MKSGRAALARAVIAGIVGGLLVLLASGRRWGSALVPLPAHAGAQHVTAAGHQVAGSLSALAFALLALSIAIPAARNRLRRVVGIAIVVIAAVTVYVSVSARGHVARTLEHREVGIAGIPVHAGANGWWVVVLIGGLIGLAVGAITTVRGPGWSALGAKYDAPVAQPRVTADPEAEAWLALDRGEDPTA